MITRAATRKSAARQMKLDGYALFAGVALVVFVVMLLLFYIPAPS